jgi:hypothetical protein
MMTVAPVSSAATGGNRRRARLLSYVAVILLTDILLLLLMRVHPFASEIVKFAPKARELLGLHIPSSNFYPIGPAILYAPFVALGLGTTAVILVYLTIGMVFYCLLCDRIASFPWRLGALAGLVLNLTFLTNVQWGEDTIFQFVCLMAASYLMVTYRRLAFAVIALLAALVRSTDFLVFLVFALAMFATERRKTWLLFPLLYALVAVFNMAEYGSPAPSLNGGYNIFLGQDPLYPVAHPEFDVATFFEGHGFMDPDKALPPGTPRTEVGLDKAYRDAGLKSLLRDPAQFVYEAFVKSTHWLFNTDAIPTTAGRYTLQSDAAGKYWINIDKPPTPQGYLLRATYVPYKIVYNALFVAALGGVLIAWAKLRRFDPMALLLLTTIVTLPIAVLAFPNTRFKINYEILALPAIALYAPLFIRTLRLGLRGLTQTPTRTPAPTRR